VKPITARLLFRWLRNLVGGQRSPRCSLTFHRWPADGQGLTGSRHPKEKRQRSLGSVLLAAHGGQQPSKSSPHGRMRAGAPQCPGTVPPRHQSPALRGMPAARARHRRQLLLLRQRPPDHRAATRTRRPAHRASAGLDARPRLATSPPTAMPRRSQIAASIKSRDAQDPVPILVTGQPQRGPDRAPPPGPSRSARPPFPVAGRESLSAARRRRHEPAHSGRTCRRA